VIGGFQVGPFQLAYQQVISQTTVTGGWEPWHAELAYYTARRRRLQQQAKEAEQEAIEAARDDKIQKEIARRLHAQLQKDQEQQEITRLRGLVDSFEVLTNDNNRIQTALLKAKSERTFSRLQALQRELIKAQEEEEMALLMILLVDE
jgi:hypothetical protein